MGRNQQREGFDDSTRIVLAEQDLDKKDSEIEDIRAEIAGVREEHEKDKATLVKAVVGMTIGAIGILIRFVWDAVTQLIKAGA